MKTRSGKEQVWEFPKKVFRVFLVFILILFVQLSYLSLSPTIYGKNMDELASQRNTVSRKLYASRGSIYDRDKNVLALNVSSYTVIAYLSESRTGNSKVPLHVVDKERTAKELAPILNMKEETLLNLLSRKAYQVELGPGGRGISELKKDEIAALNLPGIDFVESYKRYYPNGDFASYTLGYAKLYEEVKDTGSGLETIYNIVGELGIEAKYDDILRGKDGKLTYQRDRFGYKIPDTKEERIDAVNGDDIYLTIDANIQRFIEGAIKEEASKYKPEWMQITVMDAKTGEILGTASTPSFDPNIKNIASYENPLISYLYEPGSTMKTYTYMCAMEKGVYKGDETFLSGSKKIGTDVVNDWNNTGWGVITFDKGYEYSSNVGIANIIEKWLTKDELKECFLKYGFGDLTGIELSRELVGKLEFNYPIEIATAAFGQGITTTAIQQLQALTLIANDGHLVRPRIVDKIVSSKDGSVIYQRQVEKSEKLVSTKTVEKIKDLMYDVVNGTDEGTTGRAYRIPDFDIIGKTGTSQIFNPATGKYYIGDNNHIFSFSGMYPKDDPQVIVYASMKKPESEKYRALSNATKSVMKSVATYLNMFPEVGDDTEISKYEVPSFINKNTDEVVNKLKEQKIDVYVLGDGNKIIDQYPKMGSTILMYDKVILLTNDSEIKIPNIKGWSLTEVQNLAKLLNIDIEAEGYGYVTEQSIPPGSLLNREEKLIIKLEKRYELDNS